MSELVVDAGLQRRARTTTRRAARTFSLACRLLPAEVRQDVYLLYLVFRTLDDLVDDGPPAVARERVAAVEGWCDGRPARTTDETVVLDALAARHPLPRAALRDFCAGMRDDLDGWRPATEADVDRYCYRVAGTVGLVMAAVLGTDDPDAAAAACSLGMAMQRTNILRDIDEDEAAGRRYLSADAVARHGAPVPGRRAGLLAEQIARADTLYDEGLRGVRHLRRGRPAIRAAAGMYREILRQLEREGLGERPGRAVVSPGRKVRSALHTVATRR
ncbi:15-cis-phytoene synthase [Paraconexibacter sp. AEG42_29]|uniref:15-cis-phytoene synthase n=1 Tax=Paraconexibacter sp. AEG42_29 TaxID=2997339 RepID=A0AAU7AR00_9ACTN